MTQLFFMSAFAMGLGYFLGKSFKGLNPFILLFAFIPILAMSSAFLLEQNSNIYTGFFILGFIYNYGNPVRRVFDSISDAWAHHRYRKMIRDEEAMKESIESEVNNQVHEANERLRRQEEEALKRVQREAEELRRQKAAFEREKANNRSQSSANSRTESYEDILELSPGFTKSDVRKAYKRMSAAFHPDRYQDKPEAVKKMMKKKQQELNVARDELLKRFK